MQISEHAFEVMAATVMIEETALYQDGVFAQRLMPVLADAVKRRKDLGDIILLSAIGAMCDLARSEGSVAIILEEQVIRQLIELMKQSARGSSLQNSVTETAIGLLSNLSTHRKGREALVGEGAISDLVAACKAQSGTQVQEAAKTLALLGCECESSRELLVSEGAVPFISDLCFRIPGSTTILIVAQAVSNLTLNDDTRVQVMQEGLLEAALHICEVTNEIAVMRVAATALRNLSLKMQCREAMTQAGTTSTLVLVCESMLDALSSGGGRDGVTVLQQAMQALTNLSYAVNSRAKLISDGVLQPLAPLCERLGIQAGVLVAELLQNLTRSDDCLELLVKKGAALPLMGLCHSKHPPVLESASGALANLCSLEANRLILINEAVVSSLIRITTNEAAGTASLANAAAALRNLARR